MTSCETTTATTAATKTNTATKDHAATKTNTTTNMSNTNSGLGQGSHRTIEFEFKLANSWFSLGYDLYYYTNIKRLSYSFLLLLNPPCTLRTSFSIIVYDDMSK
jgi:hypothetical protein